MNFILPVITLCQREIVRFYRQRSRLLGALGTPVIFWLLIGSGIGASFRPPSAPQEMNYLEYFYPGTLLLIILFTSIFSTISVIEDRREGFLLSVLVSPIPRSALVVGKLMGGATLAFLQSVPFLLLAPAVGISLAMANLPALVFSLFLIAFVLTGLGFVFAWQIDSTQGFHAVMNLLLFPLWLLSGSVFPPSGAASWIQWIMKLNPLTYGVSSLRHALYGDSAAIGADLPSALVSVAVMSGFGTLVLILSVLLTARRRAKGVI